MGIKLIDKINAEQTANVAEKNFPEFHTGDIVRVSIKIKEGESSADRTSRARFSPSTMAARTFPAPSPSPARATVSALRSSSRSPALGSRRSR